MFKEVDFRRKFNFNKEDFNKLLKNHFTQHLQKQQQNSCKKKTSEKNKINFINFNLRLLNSNI